MMRGFGSALAIDGDTMVIGSDEAALVIDAAYLFERSSSERWSETAYFKAPAPLEGDEFGATAAFMDGHAAVGCPSATRPACLTAAP
jgi:hypothetical protein